VLRVLLVTSGGGFSCVKRIRFAASVDHQPQLTVSVRPGGWSREEERRDESIIIASLKFFFGYFEDKKVLKCYFSSSLF
jgi:hypothetical protein